MSSEGGVSVEEVSASEYERRIRVLFGDLVDSYEETKVWSGSHAQGLFAAFLRISGEDPGDVLERLHEAVEDIRQARHDEMLASMERESLDPPLSGWSD